MQLSATANRSLGITVQRSYISPANRWRRRKGLNGHRETLQLMDKTAAIREAQLQRLEATLASGQPQQTQTEQQPRSREHSESKAIDPNQS